MSSLVDEPTVTPRGGHPRFYELLTEIADLHEAKNHDYATDADPLRNLRGSEDVGVPAWIGTVIRMGDKYSRISGFAKKGSLKVKDESVKDTLRDLAVYSLLALILYEESEKNG